MFGTRLGKLLMDEGVLTNEELERALSRQSNLGGRLGESLQALGICHEAHVARALARQWEIPFVDLERTPPARNLVQRLRPEVARALKVIPVRTEGHRIVVVALNPLDIYLDPQLQRQLGSPVLVAAGIGSQIERALQNYEGLTAWSVQAPPKRVLEFGLQRKAAIEADLADRRLTLNQANAAASRHLAEGGTVEVEFTNDGARLRAHNSAVTESLGMLPESARRVVFQRTPDGGHLRIQ